MQIKLPSDVEKILNKLNSCGFESFIVGGCVRDSIMGNDPHDWDITTNALPDQVIKCFKDYKIIETGIKHGTVTLMVNSNSYEITTYRVDGKYTDNRHPDNVNFTTSLREDLQRRDFTINAIAYNPIVGMIDYFNGYEDITRKLIRCVGDPDERFNEDGLRIMRALRFASVLDFTISESTSLSIHFYKNLLLNIASERINTELCKLLCGKNVAFILNNYHDVLCVFIPEIEQTIGFKQNNPYHCYDVWTHTVKTVSEIPNNKILKLTALFHDISKPLCYTQDENKIGHFYGHATMGADVAKEIMMRLKFDNESIVEVRELILHHDLDIVARRKHIKRWLNKIGEQRLHQLIEVKKADILAQNLNYRDRINDLDSVTILLKTILEERQCFNLKDLAVNGYDIMSFGVPAGVQIGQILNSLLTLVINEEIENNRELLLTKAIELVK